MRDSNFNVEILWQHQEHVAWAHIVTLALILQLYPANTSTLNQH